MTHDQWRSFGALLAGVHAVDLPPSVQAALPREDHATATATATATAAAATVRALAAQVRGPRDPGGGAAADPLARDLIRDWSSASRSIAVILEAAELLGGRLRARPRRDVLCHGDAHTANILIDHDGQVWLIDADDAVLAPPGAGPDVRGPGRDRGRTGQCP